MGTLCVSGMHGMYWGPRETGCDQGRFRARAISDDHVGMPRSSADRLPVRCSASLLCLALALGASPATAKEVLVAARGKQESQWALRAADAAGHDVTDGSELYNRTRAMVFDLNEERPPGSWPPAIRGVWDKGMAACHSLRTQPTFTIQDKDAWLCSRDLAPAVWQQYIDHLAPWLVLEVSVSQPERSGPYDVEVRAYEPGATVMRVQTERSRDPRGAVEDLVEAALAGRGRVSPRAVLRELPKPKAKATATAPPRTDVVLKTPVKVPDGCPALPTALALRGPTTHSVAYLGGAWTAAIPDGRRGGPALACDLTSTSAGSSNPLFRGSAMKSFGFTLTCAGEAVVQKRGLGISEAHGLEQAAPALLQALVDEACEAP